jgi:transposase
MADTPKRRRRRRFDDDFKAQAVRLVLDEGKSVGNVARDLDLTETALREWVHRARADRSKGKTGLTTAEREELAQLRRENRILQEEREILKKAAAYSRGRRNVMEDHATRAKTSVVRQSEGRAVESVAAR